MQSDYVFLNAKYYNSDLLYKRQMKRDKWLYWILVHYYSTLMWFDKARQHEFYYDSSISLLTSCNEFKFLDNIVANFVLNLTDVNDHILWKSSDV